MNPQHINYYIAGIFMLFALRLTGDGNAVPARAQYVPAFILTLIAIILIAITYLKDQKK